MSLAVKGPAKVDEHPERRQKVEWKIMLPLLRYLFPEIFIAYNLLHFFFTGEASITVIIFVYRVLWNEID